MPLDPLVDKLSDQSFAKLHEDWGGLQNRAQENFALSQASWQLTSGVHNSSNVFIAEVDRLNFIQANNVWDTAQNILANRSVAGQPGQAPPGAAGGGSAGGAGGGAGAAGAGQGGLTPPHA
jgi:hypothetical protein